MERQEGTALLERREQDFAEYEADIITRLYSRLRKGGKRKYDNMEWLMEKKEAIRLFIENLKAEGKRLDIEKLVYVLNRIAEQEGLRRKKIFTSKSGRKRAAYEGILIRTKTLEKFLKEENLI